MDILLATRRNTLVTIVCLILLLGACSTQQDPNSSTSRAKSQTTFDRIEMGMSDRQLQKLLGKPRKETRHDNGEKTYEWLNPDRAGWYIETRFNNRGQLYYIVTTEIPPDVAAIPNRFTASSLRYTLTGHIRETNSVLVTPDEKWVVTGSADGFIRIWDLASGKLLRTIDSDDWVTKLAISADGQTLIQIGSNLTTWNIATGEKIQQQDPENAGGITTAVDISTDRQTFAKAINNEVIQLWNTNTGKIVRSLTTGRGNILAIAFNPNGQVLAQAQSEGSGANLNPIRLWNLQQGKELSRLLPEYTYIKICIKFSPDGQILATANGLASVNDTSASAIKLWDWQTGKLLQTLPLPSQTGGIYALAFSPDNRILASGRKDGSIQLWDTRTGKELKTLTGHTNAVIDLTFTPTGQTLVSGSDDRTVKVWQVRTSI